MSDARTTHLVFGLASEATRGACARALAERLAADATIVFVRDLDIEVLVPAPGFPSTLPGGPLWRDLLDRCAAAPGIHRGDVSFPDASTRRPAVACMADAGAALILPGVSRVNARIRGVVEAFAPVGAALRAEQRARALERQLFAAHDAAIEARALASALDLARNEADRLNREMRDTDHRKDEFLAMLAHELRNPLSPLRAAIHLVRVRLEAGQPIAGELEVMDRQVEQLTRLIDDLLDVSRITRGKIELRRERVRLDTVLSRAIETVRPILDQRRHALTLALPRDPVFLDADVARLVQVFGNLLHNAAKYTDPMGHIDVQAHVVRHDVEVSITDDGVGIAPEDLPCVFDVFVQGPRSLDRSQGGLGLGLAVVRSLIHMHDGKVFAASAGRGCGTRVTVCLPRAEAPIDEPEAPASLPAPPSRREAATRILIVEDNPDAAAMLAALLRAWGCDVRVAFDGEQAIVEAIRYLPQAILLDIGLPGMNGYEVARSVHARLPDVRLIALSGYSSARDRATALAAGFERYLAKPVDPESLRGALE